MTMPDGGAAATETVSLLGRRVRVIDLSQRLSNATSSFEPMPHAIEYFDHRDTVALVRERFGLGAEHWRDGLVWAHERVTLTTIRARMSTLRITITRLRRARPRAVSISCRLRG